MRRPRWPDTTPCLPSNPPSLPRFTCPACCCDSAALSTRRMRRLAEAIQAAPAYSEARAALANLRRERGDADGAALLCREGLAMSERDVVLWRALGLCELARHDAAAARDAFVRALELVPTDGDTHYNHGVALQTLHQREEALGAYQRALAFAPDLIAADFNIGVILQEQRRTDLAVAVFEKVLSRDPVRACAYKALADTLLTRAARRRLAPGLCPSSRRRVPSTRPRRPGARGSPVPRRFSPRLTATSTACDRMISLRRARPTSRTVSSRSCFSCSISIWNRVVHFGLYRAYDAVAGRVYGTPLSRPPVRRPGRLRIGYLSGDLCNHVMGKMMWEAIRHHDRDRFRDLLLQQRRRERRV